MLDLSKEEGNEHFHGAHPWRPRDELTVKLVEEGGDEVAQRVAAARVRLEFRRDGAPAARDANGATAVLLRAEDARRQGCGRKKRLPLSPFYSRGVVTAPVTTPPGSPVGWDLCGQHVAAPARV